METQRIGSLDSSPVGLGCNQFGRKIDASQSAQVVHAAIDAGITFFDTADRYGYGDLPFSGAGQSEIFLGRAVQGRREQVLIATKFGIAMADDAPNPGTGRAYVMAACEASLRRLETDYIDLYQVHRPDPSTPIEETLGALDELVRQGKVREIGWCNVTASHIKAADLAAVAATRFVSVQNEYSLLHREVESDALPVCIDRDISFIPYFPLASGLLTGKYRRGKRPPRDARLATFAPNRPHLGLTPDNLRLVDALADFAESSGHSMVELAVSWLLAQPNVGPVIAGATTTEQVRADAVAGTWELSSSDQAAVRDILERTTPAAAG